MQCPCGWILLFPIFAALVHKVLRMGNYWPTIQQDSAYFALSCDKCQHFKPYLRQPLEELTSVSNPWPFAKWGIDLIGSLPKARGQVKYVVVAIDYYTKWVETEPLDKITDQKFIDFFWKNIICRFGIQNNIVSNHGTQFDC